jgi:hypothetical protein
MYADNDEQYEQFDAPVTQEDSWAVISSYFEEKGLGKRAEQRRCPLAASNG